jgi:PAS domain S-box-containing protein
LIKLKSTITQANEKTKKLEEIAQTEALRTWHTEGLAIFNEITRNTHEDLEKLSFELISELVKYTKSNQGGLFVVNSTQENDIFLELRGCYAYERKRYQKKRIDSGEGLVGTAWREGKTILITDIPQGYVQITSGLGKATPHCLLIAPITSDEEVIGVIELISFSSYKTHEIEFVEALAHRIGSTLVSIIASIKTKHLLAITEDIAQQAQAKESQLQRQLDDYQYWVQQFENKLNDVSEEALVYRSILGKVYAGLIITDEKFKITKVNSFVTQRFNYRKQDLVNKPIETILEVDYDHIVDLKDKKFNANPQKLNQNDFSNVKDKAGKVYDIEILSGKLEMETRIIYIFLFNETESSENQNTNGVVEHKLRVA